MDINTTKLIKGTPRPHYLKGIGKYEKKDNCYYFSSTVNFASEGNPSISDRKKKYVSKPHVNVGDCCFALWNAVHIMAELSKYKERILRKKILIEPKSLIPPDTDLNLEVLVKEEQEITKKEKIYSLGTIYGSFYQNKKELIKITANYCAEK